MNEVKVNRDELYKVYTSMRNSLTKLQCMLAEIGCIHSNKINTTTMGASETLQKYYCPDCDVTIDEVNDDE